MEDEFVPELTQDALDKGYIHKLKPQGRLPAQVELRPTCSFFVRDIVVPLQQEGNGQQARRNGRAAVVQAIKRSEVVVREKLMPVVGQVDIETVLPDQIAESLATFEERILCRAFA